MTQIENTTARKIFLNGIKNDNVHVFTGAGISMISPSTLPSGKELKELIVRASTKHKRIENYLSILESDTKYMGIVPEIIFQDIYSSIGDRLFPAFNILNNSISNHIHKSLANILDNFKVYNFTTNFDLLVDNNQLSFNKNIHLHGSLNNPSEMAMRIYEVGKGVNKELSSKFLLSVKNKSLFIFGYSGNDMDIIELINASEVKSIYWLMRNVNSKWTINNIKRINKNIKIFEDDLGDFFNYLNKELKLEFEKEKHKPKLNILKKYSNSLSEFDKHFVLGHLLFRVSNFHAAQNLFKLILSLRVFSTIDQYLTAIIFYTDCIRLTGIDSKQGIALLKSGYNKHKKKGDRLLIAGLKNMHGLLLLENKYPKHNKATSHFLIAKNIYEKELENTIHVVKVNTLLARVYNNLGLCYQNNPKYLSLAATSFKKSINLKRLIGNYLGLATSMVNLCLIYLSQRKMSSYYYWRSKAIYLIEKYDMLYRKSYLFREEGRHFISFGNSNYGLKKLNSALEILEDSTPSATIDIEIIKDMIKKTLHNNV